MSVASLHVQMSFSPLSQKHHPHFPPENDTEPLTIIPCSLRIEAFGTIFLPVFRLREHQHNS